MSATKVRVVRCCKTNASWDFRGVTSLMAASVWSSHTLPIVHAAVSLTTTDGSCISSMSIGIACSTIGRRFTGSGPSRTAPNAIREASRYRQSECLMFS